MRRGFSLVTGIFLMVAIAALAVAILSLAATTSVQKSQAFLRAQAELLARSATEYAVLKVSEGTILPDMTDSFAAHNAYIRADPFDINITVRFIAEPGISDDINGTAIVDVVVEAPDLDMPIRYNRRTVQVP
ncbi:MAG: hypothetical protein LBE89_08025 [Helicobacteraceae bacterium]|jgi:hypothetical protein|nr:hypothetical protein [Helicobacteraceae bacterium]